jgi:hypothetical protein
MNRARWLAMFILLGAVANLPFAMSRFIPRRSGMTGGMNISGAEASTYAWPTRTPHKASWPPIHQWMEQRRFGQTFIFAYGGTGEERFEVQTQLAGWPLYTLEESSIGGHGITPRGLSP